MQRGRSAVRLAVVCLLGGVGILGIAHVALLPPWEGFDEQAHYSSLQQVADAHEVPRLGRAYISEDVQSYRQSAPTRYPHSLGDPLAGPYTYQSFFEASPDVVEHGRSIVHGRPLEARHYAASNRLNWEAQHPPLYYAVLSPAYAGEPSSSFFERFRISSPGSHWSWESTCARPSSPHCAAARSITTG